VESHGFSMFWGGVVIVSWLAILALFIVLVNVVDTKHPTPVDFFETFLRVGSMIYGGGQVVLPLLEHEVVDYKCTGAGNSNCATSPTSWVTYEQFYAGLAVVQVSLGVLFLLALRLAWLCQPKVAQHPTKRAAQAVHHNFPICTLHPAVS
jgi:chromate transporter